MNQDTARCAGTILLLTLLLAPAPTRAGAPSIRPGMPPEVKSWRETILAKDDYSRLLDQWRVYSREHPTLAIGYVEMARAMRYAGSGTMEDREALLKKALDLDPSCPEALDAMASYHMMMASSLEEGLALGQRAVELAPDWPEPHFTLWSICVVQGKNEEARAQVKAILDKRGIPAPILDLGFNLLASAEPNAILLTNGDNDTYPPVALQVVRGVRPDVLVVNLSLLNLPQYAATVWKSAGWKSPLPFSPEEVQALHDQWKSGDPKKGPAFSPVLLNALLAKVRSGSWSGPVYLAVTVPQLPDADSGLKLNLEGLLWRVEPAAGAGAPASSPEPAVNADKTLRLFQNEFRMDSATDLSYPWGPGSAAGMLVRNYTAVLTKLAAACAARGDLGNVGYALRKALGILEFQGDTEGAKRMARYWKQLDPSSKEPDRLL